MYFHLTEVSALGGTGLVVIVETLSLATSLYNITYNDKLTNLSLLANDSAVTLASSAARLVQGTTTKQIIIVMFWTDAIYLSWK